MAKRDELLRAEGALREYATLGREALSLEGLTVYTTPGNASPFLRVAVPDAGRGPRDWPGAVRRLLEAFPDAAKGPGLEFMPALHPGLAAALNAARFERTSLAPVLTARAAAWAPPPEPLPGRYRDLAEASPSELEAFVDAQSAAFGMPSSLGRAWLPVLAEALPSGRVLGAALESDGRPVSGATLQVAPSGAELAGVWTQREARRQGLAFALCAALLQRAAAADVEHVWLSAARGAEGVYRRLGFRRVGRQATYRRSV